jgi:hypothetical protein
MAKRIFLVRQVTGDTGIYFDENDAGTVTTLHFFDAEFAIEGPPPAVDTSAAVWSLDSSTGDAVLNGDLDMIGLSATAGFVGMRVAMRWRKLRAEVAGGRTTLHFDQMRLEAAQLPRLDVEGDLTLVFDAGQWQAGESRFKRYEPDAASSVELEFSQASFSQPTGDLPGALRLGWEEPHADFWLQQLSGRLVHESVPAVNSPTDLQLLFDDSER